MGTAERRLEILKYLCRARKAKMTELAERFGVSVRTIQRDIYEIEDTFHAPLKVKCGKYDSGIYVVGDYSFDRMYMHDDELALLRKIQDRVKGQLSSEENFLFAQIIKKYSKSAQKFFNADSSCLHEALKLLCKVIRIHIHIICTPKSLNELLFKMEVIVIEKNNFIAISTGDCYSAPQILEIKLKKESERKMKNE